MVVGGLDDDVDGSLDGHIGKQGFNIKGRKFLSILNLKVFDFQKEFIRASAQLKLHSRLTIKPTNRLTVFRCVHH